MNEIRFLDIDEIIHLHDLQLSRFGGLAGIRDIGLLESAAAMPQAGFGGEFVHEDLFAMAAAYLFHLVKNHPFSDGNKRVGFHAAYVFLLLNGVILDLPEDDAYDLVIATAEGRATKDEIALSFRTHARTL